MLALESWVLSSRLDVCNSYPSVSLSPDDVFPMQLPPNVPGKTMDNGFCSWEMQVDVLFPGFSLARPAAVNI